MDKNIQRIIVMLYLRKRKARHDLHKYMSMDEKWGHMKDQARGSLFEATMALAAAKKISIT